MLLNNKEVDRVEFIPTLLPVFLRIIFLMVLNIILGIFASDRFFVGNERVAHCAKTLHPP